MQAKEQEEYLLEEMREEEFETENKTIETINRWIYILRSKASEYEHKARGRGEIVSVPSIDDICNEMKAFIGGYEAQNNPSKPL